MTGEMSMWLGSTVKFTSKKTDSDGSECTMYHNGERYYITPQEAKAVIKVMQHYLREE